MATKQEKDGTEILDAAAPRPEATPQAPSTSDAEQREADAYQAQATAQGQAEMNGRIDSTAPGGRYLVDGRTVDAEGREV